MAGCPHNFVLAADDDFFTSLTPRWITVDGLGERIDIISTE